MFVFGLGLGLGLTGKSRFRVVKLDVKESALAVEKRGKDGRHHCS